MSEWEKEGYRNKNAKFRVNKRNIKQQRKVSMKNKNSFINDENVSNINDIPLSIYNEQKNKIFQHKNDNESFNNTNDNECSRINNKSNMINNESNIINNDIMDDSDEYEEFTPEYFEPIPYVKK